MSVGGKTQFACVDGPEFDGHQVDFDLLMLRQRMYLHDEKLSLERFEETWKLDIQDSQRCHGACVSDEAESSNLRGERA